MNARVETHVYGGQGTATHANLDEFGTVATVLNEMVDPTARVGADWRTAGLDLFTIRTKAPICPKIFGARMPQLQASSPEAPTDAANPPNATIQHVSLNYSLVTNHINERADEAVVLAQKMQDLADKLTEAYSMYSEADDLARRLFGEGLQLGTTMKPGLGVLALGATAMGSTIAGSIKEGRFNPIYAITGTSKLHEGMLSALGSAIVNGDQDRSERALKGLEESNEVNQAAGILAEHTSKIKDILFGNKLTVSQIHPKKGIGETRSIEDTLTNVHDMRLNDVPYGSIAIQKYRREDGSTAWMVTIPGTDGKIDSPFDWFTNMELMSDKHRATADSVRMVDEAMRQAGIQPGDPVAMVGHSQGGIVAATMASDFADKYNIKHVVTAGSPIANHSIKDGITVTSVEMEDELVSALDGAPNPSNPDWVTVSGTSPPMGSDKGTVVEGSGNRKFLTHGMEYMKAAYRNAQEQGGPALYDHEQRFKQTINGTLEETTYWRGKISHGAQGSN
ncbi:hypothetical protein EP30_04150 [Bifidobacterium sp. UTCIF-39]|uniref:esterase/lipase family protein n=1 Tax=Bifidobacterium sp. UTCIF-39 TaxID=1465359 RepID=UPI00112CEAF9|nr:alpha/beta hydrolase [Bifidobacterium sp. UTCIF-39]TPF97145.1 hypothetical protein EP30_04150 [Bifidobacterium sp. UTCIF-39]